MKETWKEIFRNAEPALRKLWRQNSKLRLGRIFERKQRRWPFAQLLYETIGMKCICSSPQHSKSFSFSGYKENKVIRILYEMGVGFFLEIIATTNPQLKIFPVWAISSKKLWVCG